MAERAVARLPHRIAEQKLDLRLCSSRIVHAAIPHPRPIRDQDRDSHAARVCCARIPREERLRGSEFRSVRDLRRTIRDGLVGEVEHVE